MTITVVIADDQPLMRAALRMCLATEPDIEVVAEAADGLQAVALATRRRPDVVVMDIRMPSLDGIAATRRLAAPDVEKPVKVLAITTFNLDEYVVEALRAGASGFLLKDATPQELVHAVRVVAAGDALLAPAVTRRLLDRYARHLPPVTLESSLKSITNRELAVLKLVARGLSNTKIGQELHIAESSVKTHVSHLLAKLGLHDRVQLVVFAYESGLVHAADANYDWREGRGFSVGERASGATAAPLAPAQSPRAHLASTEIPGRQAVEPFTRQAPGFGAEETSIVVDRVS